MKPTRAFVAALALASALLSAGCSTLAYYAQAVQGHLDLLGRAQAVQALLAAPDTPAPLRRQLHLAQELRAYAIGTLQLPDTRSYRRYADLERAAAVWNVVAAPEFSLTLQTWCFPLMGCVGYRGYFDRAAADALAAQLRAQQLEVWVYGVPAYSTLGWTEWLGGDPLLSTFIHWPEAELARLIFHELAHQMAYAVDDTSFNESYASAVARLGSQGWLASRPVARAAAERSDARREQWRELLQRQRERLQALYAQALSADDKRARKAELMARWRAEVEALKREHWNGFAGYDAQVAQANNASFGVQAAYDDLVPAFERLFARCKGDWGRFHAEVKRLADLPKAQRRAALQALQGSQDQPDRQDRQDLQPRR